MNDGYFGQELSDQQLDLLTLELVPAELVPGENALYSKKWWGYRHMHPMRATYLFADWYKKAYKETASKRMSSEEAARLRIFPSQDPMKSNPSIVRGLWLGRRMADELGITYRFYCRRAVDISERLDWSYLCRPEDLTNKALVERLGVEWLEYSAKVMSFPPKELVDLNSYYHEQWEAELAAFAKRQINPQSIIRNALKDGYMTEAGIQKHLREEFGHLLNP
jgi:hypothetical protein